MASPSFTEKILWRRAQDWLAAYRPQLVAITGSTGKTIAATAVQLALSHDRSVRIATPGDNTPLSVAKAILGLPDAPGARNWMRLLARSAAREIKSEEPDALIVEVGASKPGDVDRVAIRMSPQVVIVTNVGTAHTRLLGEKELVAHEFESLVATASPDTTIILNADDELTLGMAERAKGPVMLVGRGDDADVQIVRTHRLPHGGLGVELSVHGQGYEVTWPTVLGQHHLPLLGMGLAAAHALGVPTKQALASIKKWPGLSRRMEGVNGVHESRIIDDTYNATPESMKAGLSTLRTLSAKRRIAVLGDITDLGGESLDVHQQIGTMAAEVANMVIVVGQEIEAAGAVALRSGVDVHHFADSDEVGKWLPGLITKGDLIYVSGSRDMQMGDVVDRLKTAKKSSPS